MFIFGGYVINCLSTLKKRDLYGFKNIYYSVFWKNSKLEINRKYLTFF